MKSPKFEESKTRHQSSAPQFSAPQPSTSPKSKQTSNKTRREKKKDYRNRDKVGQKSPKGSTPAIEVNLVEPETSSQKKKNNQNSLDQDLSNITCYNCNKKAITWARV